MAKSFIEEVRNFQYAFKHPVGGQIHALADTPARKTLRCSWLQEELDELANALSLVDKMDAIIDFQYFLTGNLVEMGVTQQKWAYVYNKLNGYERGTLSCSDLFHDGIYRRRKHGLQIHKKHVVIPLDLEMSFFLKLQDHLDLWEAGETVNDELKQIYTMQRTLIDLCLCYGVNYKEYQACFDAVHNANMKKLWEDGKPHYNSEGKVKKPKGWERFAPERRLKEILCG